MHLCFPTSVRAWSWPSWTHTPLNLQSKLSKWVKTSLLTALIAFSTANIQWSYEFSYLLHYYLLHEMSSMTCWGHFIKIIYVCEREWERDVKHCSLTSSRPYNSGLEKFDLVGLSGFWWTMTPQCVLLTHKQSHTIHSFPTKIVL